MSNERPSDEGTKTRTSFGPVVTGAALTKDKVVGSEEPSKGPRAERVHRTRLEINQDGAGNIFQRRNFVVVDVDSFELKIVVSPVYTVGADAMFV